MYIEKNRLSGLSKNGVRHFSYNNDLVYREHKYNAHKIVQDMIGRAYKSMEENQFK
jgi:hypothetical protein